MRILIIFAAAVASALAASAESKGSLPVANPLRPDEVAVWPCDSMRRVTPLTYPSAAERAASTRAT